jgi:DNA-binding NarL/FixJ family response regulator
VYSHAVWFVTAFAERRILGTGAAGGNGLTAHISMMNRDTKKRLLLADDHKIFTEGLRTLLAQDFDVIGVVEDGLSLVEAAVRLKPDVIVADIAMPEINGIEALRRIRELHVNAKVVMLTMYADSMYAAEAIRAGAAGYVMKSCATSELKAALEAALSGRIYLSPRLAEVMGQRIEKPGNPGQPLERLTARQRQVLQLVAQGRSSKEIASILRISLKTAEFHRHNIMETLGIHSIAELTRYAIGHGLVGPL